MAYLCKALAAYRAEDLCQAAAVHDRREDDAAVDAQVRYDPTVQMGMQDRVNPGSGAEATVAAIRKFHDAFNSRDVDAVMATMTDDCVAELPYPPPDGLRYEGSVAVRAAWETFFTSSPAATFEIEEMAAWGDRAVVRWLYRWKDTNGLVGHVRGVDVMRVRNGKVAESLGYVKG